MSHTNRKFNYIPAYLKIKMLWYNYFDQLIKCSSHSHQLTKFSTVSWSVTVPSCHILLGSTASQNLTTTTNSYIFSLPTPAQPSESRCILKPNPSNSVAATAHHKRLCCPAGGTLTPGPSPGQPASAHGNSLQGNLLTKLKYSHQCFNSQEITDGSWITIQILR